MNKKLVQTVKDRIPPENLGLTLPHEHIFTDLRGPSIPDYAQAKPEEVAAVMLPFLKAAHKVGVRTLVECSTVGVGRNVTILEHLAQATPIHLIIPTGVYREGFIPKNLIRLGVEELGEIWVRELTEGIEGTGVRAGFIKIATSDGGPTAIEERNLKAAAIASRDTGAIIACHTSNGEVARREMDILQASRLDLKRFIWVHANLEPDLACHREAAKRGAIIEFDAVGAPWSDQEKLLEATLSLIEAGFADQLLLSHDAGWYQPGSPGGQPEGGIRGYTSLVEDFLPRLQAGGVTKKILQKITVSNPARIFAFAPT